MTRSELIPFALLVAAAVACLSFALSFFSSKLARAFGVVDMPSGGRKIHARSVPLWGGLGIACTLVIALITTLWYNIFLSGGLGTRQLAGYLVGVLILLVGGLVDDRRPLPPRAQILFPILAALAVIASGTGIIQITNPATQRGFSLIWWKSGFFSLPADLITFAWLLIATYATKLLDGLDGLVAGMAVIGSALVGALSSSLSFFQPGIAILSAIIGGAYLGILPRNAHPSKLFLGEAGSTIAGFSLGVLAILSSAKVAIALTVLAIPITDVALVIGSRIRRGVPWYEGDNAHLHFRLLQAGLSQRTAVFLLWAIALFAGLIALTLQTRGKIFLIATLIVLTTLMSFGIGSRRIDERRERTRKRDAR